jgi:hypothetical protein
MGAFAENSDLNTLVMRYTSEMTIIQKTGAGTPRLSRLLIDFEPAHHHIFPAGQ